MRVSNGEDCVVLTSGVAALSGLFFGTMLEEDAGAKEAGDGKRSALI